MHPLGGLARRATIIEKERHDADGILLVSAGDDLHGTLVPPPLTGARAHLVLDVYAALGYDAMGLGERDREAGVALGQVHGEALVERAGIRVGVFSFDLGSDGDPGSIAGAPELSRRAAALRKRGARLVVALVHGPSARAEAVLRTGLPIDVAVFSHDAVAVGGVRRAGDTFVVEGPAQGKSVGILDLHILDGDLHFQDLGMRSQLAINLKDHARHLAEIEARERTSNERLRPMYEDEKQKVRALEFMTRQQLGSIAEAKTSWLENRLVPLGADVADDSRVAVLVDRYKAVIAKLPAESPGLPAARGYAGITACAGCHPAAVAFWKTTKHARAWQTLVDKKQDKNPACVSCHVAGGMSGLPDVQCEACHGPAAAHARAPAVRGQVRRDAPETVCVSCHTPQQGDWKYSAYRASILGKGHGAR